MPRTLSEFLHFIRKTRTIAINPFSEVYSSMTTNLHKICHDDAESTSEVHRPLKNLISKIQDGEPQIIAIETRFASLAKFCGDWSYCCRHVAVLCVLPVKCKNSLNDRTSYDITS